MPKLIVNAGPYAALEFELKPGVNCLGRGFANDVRIEDVSVSSSHAQIVVEDEIVTVKDLGSTNGTFMDGVQIKEGLLRPGQLLRFGGVEARVISEEAVTAAVLAGATRASSAAVAGSPVVRAAPAPNARPVAAERPAPPPPTPPSGLMDPPKGKWACKFHLETPGQWLCQKCQELFCAACVSVRKTPEGATYLCRKCGSVCAPVRVKAAPRKSAPVVYSEATILLRCLGFGAAAAAFSAAIWIGLSAAMGVDIPFLFCPVAGALCGYAVKWGSQDRPGGIFSAIAIGYCLLGSIAGKVGMIMVTHLTLNSTTSLLTSGLGLLVGLFLAWKLGGGDF